MCAFHKVLKWHKDEFMDLGIKIEDIGYLHYALLSELGKCSCDVL